LFFSPQVFALAATTGYCRAAAGPGDGTADGFDSEIIEGAD
jgi:hypothetical protein